MLKKITGMIKRHVASAVGGGLVVYGYEHGMSIERIEDLLEYADLIIGTLLIIYAGGDSSLEKLKAKKELITARNIENFVEIKKPKKPRKKRKLNE